MRIFLLIITLTLTACGAATIHYKDKFHLQDQFDDYFDHYGKDVIAVDDVRQTGRFIYIDAHFYAVEQAPISFLKSSDVEFDTRSNYESFCPNQLTSVKDQDWSDYVFVVTIKVGNYGIWQKQMHCYYSKPRSRAFKGIYHRRSYWRDRIQ